MTTTEHLAPNPDCDVCGGSGEDPDFGGTCAMCWWSPMHHGVTESVRERFTGARREGSVRTAVVNPPSEKQIALIRRLDADAEIPATRKAASVLIDKLLGAANAPGRQTPQAADSIRFTKIGDEWMIRVPTSVRAGSGQTVTVTKANGETKNVVLGTRVDDELWREQRSAPKPVTLPDVPDVPEGHYAIGSKGRNDLMFVVVDRPTEGRWAGYTFVKQIVGGHEPIAIRGAQAADVLRRILDAGVVESWKLYGREIGRCGHCHRTLTSEWRKVGIGPVCAAKFG